MSGVQSNASRAATKALVVGNPSLRVAILATLSSQQIAATEADDPYHAMTELCRRPLLYKAIVLSLQSLYREELSVIVSIKRAYRHIEIWLCDIDGRSAALAEAMRLGADGLLTEDGLHRLGAERPVALSQAPVERDRPATDHSKPQDAVRTSIGNGRPVESPVVPILRTTPAPAPAPVEVEEPVGAATARRGERAARATGWTDSRSSDAEPAPVATSPVSAPQRVEEPPSHDEPVLTADELRALLSDQGGT